MTSGSNAAEDHRTVSELISWALTGPPDLSRGPGSEPERFAAALRKTVCQVDSMRRELEGVDSRRRPWWTLKGEAKNADIFERSIRREKAGEPWQDALRVAIERAALSPTRGEGMVRDALRANLVRDVAVTAGLKVSRGRESPPYRTACDVVALAEEIWKRGNEEDTQERHVAETMLNLLTRIQGLSATLEIANKAREEAERIAALVVASQAELEVARQAKKDAERIAALKAARQVVDEAEREFKASVDRLEKHLAETAGSAQPLRSAANMLEVWHKNDRVTGASAGAAEKAAKQLQALRFYGPGEGGIDDDAWELANRRLKVIARGCPRPWDAAVVEEWMEALETESPP